MRSLLMLVVLLSLAGAVSFWWLAGRAGAGDVAPGGMRPAPLDAIGASANGTGGGLPDGVVATRVDVSSIEPGELADRPTACLRIVDHATGEPLAGAIVRRLRSGADLAFSDERGLAEIALAKTAQLGVVCDGYLMRRAPVAVGSSAAQPQELRMVVDRWSVTRRFEFVDPNGGVVAADVFALLAPIGSGGPMPSPRADADPVWRRAWQEHTGLAVSPVAHDVAVQLGRYSADHVLRFEGGAGVAAVRFAQAGRFELRAATATGLVGAVEVLVEIGPEPPVQRVHLQQGAALRGRVLDTADAPIRGAEVRIQGGEPLGLVAQTDAAGDFTIGPLAAGEVTLLVRHGLHAPVAHGPVASAAAGVVVRLEPLSGSQLRGRVRARPSLKPIAGAKVAWQVAGGAAVQATTDRDGRFELLARGDVAAQLLVQMDGFVTYAELVEPGAPFADYDLLPASTRERLEAGLTATLEGTVTDASGRPAPRVAVRWLPDAGGAVALPANAAGRRILRGGSLELTNVTTTDQVGAFVIETDRFGGGVLRVVDEAGKARDVHAVAVAGRSRNAIELQR